MLYLICHQRCMVLYFPQRSEDAWQQKSSSARKVGIMKDGTAHSTRAASQAKKPCHFMQKSLTRLKSILPSMQYRLKIQCRDGQQKRPPGFNFQLNCLQK